MKGPFSFKYLLKGGGKEDWYKSWGLGGRFLLTLLFLTLVAFTIKKAFFTKTNTQSIVAQAGSNVKVTQINRQSRFFIPFVEGGVEQRYNEQMGTYIRAGIRVEF